MKILVLDNYDSFVYNLVHYIKQLGYDDVDVYRNDKILLDEIAKYDKIVLSPGPGIPEEAGIMIDLIKRYADSKSILGVCLGHQAIAEAFGSELENMDEVLHGVGNTIKVIEKDVIYSGVPDEFEVGRYHSWQVKKETLGETLKLTGIDENGNVMSMRHNSLDVVGVQYHPESVLTEHGLKIVENWLKN
ncbi:MAG: aminodeoxychorismate/anthranilate synthase component II [Flavobacteriales bacterium]|nr:aminodeoxychorismate/anthranilate synthase component II [Flavobacteriales bacterium]|tara:strand:+ start:1575 stop:2141 length:567 start_codon:yes stop_codon:yes gene_type:complete